MMIVTCMMLINISIIIIISMIIRIIVVIIIIMRAGSKILTDAVHFQGRAPETRQSGMRRSENMNNMIILIIIVIIIISIMCMICMYVYIYIYIHIRNKANDHFLLSEKGEVLLRGVGTLRYLFHPMPSALRQPGGFAIHAKKWFLGAGFLGAPPISLKSRTRREIKSRARARRDGVDEPWTMGRPSEGADARGDVYMGI